MNILLLLGSIVFVSLAITISYKMGKVTGARLQLNKILEDLDSIISGSIK